MVAAWMGAAACGGAGKPATPAPAAVAAIVQATPPGACEAPAHPRAEEIGCYLAAVQPLGELGAIPLYWHLYEFPNLASARAAGGTRGIAVQSFGRVILHAIAPQDWLPRRGGVPLAVIGPLTHEHGVHYTARFMEGAFRPGMQTLAHAHSGVEAFYMLNGAQCLQTPDGRTVVRTGGSAIIPAGPPMVLTGIGTEIRRSLVLVLHDSAEPWITRTPEWRPQGLCTA